MIKVSMIKVIQIRHTYIYDGKEQGYNNKFQRPGAAAKDWATWKRVEWDRRFFEITSRNPTSAESRRQEARYYNKSLPIFKRMLA